MKFEIQRVFKIILFMQSGMVYVTPIQNFILVLVQL